MKISRETRLILMHQEELGMETMSFFFLIFAFLFDILGKLVYSSIMVLMWIIALCARYYLNKVFKRTMNEE